MSKLNLKMVAEHISRCAEHIRRFEASDEPMTDKSEMELRAIWLSAKCINHSIESILNS